MWIIDAKWKIVGGTNSGGYGVDELDLYQLAAYGQKYLGGENLPYVSCLPKNKNVLFYTRAV